MCQRGGGGIGIRVKRRGGEWGGLWHTTDMSNAWVHVMRFAACAHPRGSVGLGFESHERKWGGNRCARAAWKRGRGDCSGPT
eukprot:1433056-Prymnesium_polylepis.1